MSAAAPAPSADPRFENAAIADMKRIFAAQQRTALQWRTSTAQERIARLNRLRDAVLAREGEIKQACAEDFGKPETEVDIGELIPILAEIKSTKAHLKRWMKGERVWPTALMFGTKTRVRYEPKGVSLIIAPWNYPVNLSLMPLVSALAAGCTAILKPSELTPATSKVTRELIAATFDESEVAVVEGAVEETTALLEMPFDHIFFTGSPAVGKIIMAAAAKNLTSVTLELGGKSPTIVDASADVERAAKGIMFGKFLNAGQTCIAPDYVLVHEDIKDSFIKACADHLKATYGEDATQSPDYCRIVNGRHYERVSGLLAEARAKGAVAACGGTTREDTQSIAPTILDSVPMDSRVMDEEIFGPLLPVVPYKDLNEAIAYINGKPKPLALYVYANDRRVVDKTIGETSAGGTCINTCTNQYLHMNAPFGGVNNSGIGNSHGKWGFKAFSHERTVVDNKFSASLLMAPPYTSFVKRLIHFIKLTLK
nr:aldehyde dehydrogenase family protein [Oceanococcus sp. HetDA_MAG_MS8]